MKSVQLLAAVLLATTAVGGAYAADQAAKPAAAQESPAEKNALNDVGKLSKDGAQAFQDLRAVRLAIFNADPKAAKAAIAKAQTAIDKAKTDDTAYMKAESALDTKLNENAGKTGDTKTSATDDASKPVAWLPVDGQLTLGEDFVATPEKAEAVKKENESVQKGDKKGAIETLKLADVDVNFVMAVVPLDKTAGDIDQASKLIDEGKFYEANALLKGAEQRLRFDAVDVTGMPKAAASAAKASDTKTPDTKTTETAK